MRNSTTPQRRSLPWGSNTRLGTRRLTPSRSLPPWSRSYSIRAEAAPTPTRHSSVAISIQRRGATRRLRGRAAAPIAPAREYRISAPLLEALDNEIEIRAEEERRLQRETPRSFYCHRTDDALQWLRWNLNRLCLAVELVYSIRPARHLHWEHSRVAMAMMRALHYGFGG
jgi:hypothetical protein